MAFRLYIVPMVGTGIGSIIDNARKAKYFFDGTLLDPVTGAISIFDYGIEPWAVVGADLSSADDVRVVAMPDAFAVPFNLDALLANGQVTAVKNKLEAINMPAGWVNTTLTWREVVRSVLGMCTFMQRFSAVNGGVSLFAAGVTLQTAFNALPTGIGDKILQAANSFVPPLDTTGLSGTVTVRQILKSAADQFGDRTYNFNGFLI